MQFKIRRAKRERLSQTSPPPTTTLHPPKGLSPRPSPRESRLPLGAKSATERTVKKKWAKWKGVETTAPFTTGFLSLDASPLRL